MLNTRTETRPKGPAQAPKRAGGGRRVPARGAPSASSILRLRAVRVALLGAPIWLLLLWSAMQFEGRLLAFGVAAGTLLFYCAQALAAAAEAEATFRAHAARLQAEVERRLGQLDFSDAGMSRRYIETRLEQEIRRSQRYRLPLTLVLMRTRAEGSTWDTWQEVAADIMATASQLLRTEDIFGHLAGPDFAIILPHTPRAQADVVIERLAAALAGRAPRFGLAQLWAGEVTVPQMLAAARLHLEEREGNDSATPVLRNGERAAG